MTYLACVRSTGTEVDMVDASTGSIINTVSSLTDVNGVAFDAVSDAVVAVDGASNTVRRGSPSDPPPTTLPSGFGAPSLGATAVDLTCEPTTGDLILATHTTVKRGVWGGSSYSYSTVATSIPSNEQLDSGGQMLAIWAGTDLLYYGSKDTAPAPDEVQIRVMDLTDGTTSKVCDNVDIGIRGVADLYGMCATSSSMLAVIGVDTTPLVTLRLVTTSGTLDSDITPAAWLAPANDHTPQCLAFDSVSGHLFVATSQFSGSPKVWEIALDGTVVNSYNSQLYFRMEVINPPTPPVTTSLVYGYNLE